MTIEIKKELPALQVHLAGELDHHAAESIREAIDKQLMDKRITALYVHMPEVSFMDSAGIGVLLGRYKIMSQRHGDMYLVGVSPAADRILRMAAVYDRIASIPAEQEKRRK